MRQKLLVTLAAISLCRCAPPLQVDQVSQAASAEPLGGNVVPGWTWMGFRWPNNTVPYVVDVTNSFAWPAGCGDAPTGTVPLTARQVQTLNDSLTEMRTLLPLQFVPHALNNPPSGSFLVYKGATSGGFDSVRGMPGAGCPNWIEFGDDPDDVRARELVLHETMHTLGFDHEQQRADRDDFVIFNGACVNPDYMQVVNKLWGKDTAGLLLTPYDFNSIMQYSSFNGCAAPTGGCGCPEPILTKLDGSTFGANLELSEHDVNGIYRLYEKALSDTDQANSEYGTSLASGDFDGDGYQDLAVGVPGQNAVYLYKGTGGSASPLLGRLVAWKKIDFTSLPPGTAQTQQFGYSLAAADFTGDGLDDLIIGAPGNSSETGAIYLFVQNTPTLSPRRALMYQYRADELGSTGTAGDPDDGFGTSLAAGDFDADGVIDLAVGVPRKHVGSVRPGEVIVVTPGRLAQAMTKLTAAMAPSGTNITGARFGAHLEAANLDPDQSGVIDLLVGSPENYATASDNGAVYLFRGQQTGGIVGKQVLRPTFSAPLGSGPISFGASLAVSNFYDATTAGGKTERTIAVGAPLYTFAARGIAPGAGAVFVFRPTGNTIHFAQQAQVDNPSPHTGDHFGFALAHGDDFISHSSESFLWVGAPGAGSGNVFLASTSGGSWGVNSFLPFPTTGAQRLGSALLWANYAPDPFGQPGDSELLAGAPGFSSDAGAFYLANFDQTRNGLFAVDRFQQTTANPE